MTDDGNRELLQYWKLQSFLWGSIFVIKWVVIFNLKATLIKYLLTLLLLL